MNTITPEQEQKLKLALARMLSEKLYVSLNQVCWTNSGEFGESDDGSPYQDSDRNVLESEWLHICWLIEQGLEDKENYWWALYNTQANFFSVVSTDETVDGYEMFKYINASWQQRATALCKVKGVEV